MGIWDAYERDRMACNGMQWIVMMDIIEYIYICIYCISLWLILRYLGQRKELDMLYFQTKPCHWHGVDLPIQPEAVVVKPEEIIPEVTTNG
jgi:hypothetical protein